MKNLSLKNRLSPTVVGLLCGAALAALPSIASAQLMSESWENGVDNAKWKTSQATANFTFNTPGEPADAIVLRSSITENEPECAGRYARETRGAVTGHQYTAGANIVATTANTDYCLSAWVRAEAGAKPYLSVTFATSAAGLPGGQVKSSMANPTCFLASNDTAFQDNSCNNTLPAPAPIRPITTDGTWQWVAATFKGKTGFTHAQASFANFCGNNPCPSVGPFPAFDVDDLRITAGVCPATPPADTAPHKACTGTTPVCTPGGAAANAKCSACTGNAGAPAPAIACPADRPVCQTAGAEKGACKTSCTSDFGGDGGAGACPETSPFCTLIAGSTTLKECKPCAGNNGSATMPACPAANPTCFTTGAKAGACGKCTTNAECGGATPRCDVGTGRCTDDCEQDADCGDKKSGKICLASTLKCTDGCRGDAAGNGCPDGQKCTSVDLKPGTCEPSNPVPDAGPTPTPEPTPTPTPTPTPEPTPTPTPTPEEEGGCSMSSGSVAGGTATMLVGLGVVVAAMGRRRRRD